MQIVSLASCQIMPHDIVVSTCDIQVDATVWAILVIVWLIRKKL